MGFELLLANFPADTEELIKVHYNATVDVEPMKTILKDVPSPEERFKLYSGFISGRVAKAPQSTFKIVDTSTKYAPSGASTAATPRSA